MSTQLRALVGARVSVLKGPQKVSHIAQHETGARWVAEKGHTVVGTFQDLDVSADKIGPFDRPDLKPWLADDVLHEWDLMVFSKVDRAFRSTWDCVEFARWCKDHRKVLVFAEDGMVLDYLNPTGQFEQMMAEFFVYVGSFFAQIELNRFKTRALDGHRVLRGTSRWAAGVPPLGFRTVDHPSGKGKGLDTDPEGKALLYKMAGWLLEGESFTRIAVRLNDMGALTNMDRSRDVPRKRPWTVDNVIRSLTTLRTQGYKMHKDQPVLDAAGEMIRLAPPTFDDDTWKQIQAAAAERRLNRRRRSHTANPMLGVGQCGKCGATLGQAIRVRGERVHRYYRCGRAPHTCNGVSMKADEADELLEQTFLEQYGEQFVTRRLFVPGEDNAHELDQINETIARLRRESDAGLIVGPADEELYHQRLASLIGRRSQLESAPVRSSGWVLESTGETFSAAFKSADTEGRRKMMVDRGVAFVLNGKNDWDLIVPDADVLTSPGGD